MSLLFESLVDSKIKIESRLHCIDIYDEDCIASEVLLKIYLHISHNIVPTSTVESRVSRRVETMRDVWVVHEEEPDLSVLPHRHVLHLSNLFSIRGSSAETQVLRCYYVLYSLRKNKISRISCFKANLKNLRLRKSILQRNCNVIEFLQQTQIF